MRLFYITSYTFPSKRAEPYYLKCMGEAFTRKMGNDFTLVIRGPLHDMLKNVHTQSLNVPNRFRIPVYFFWFLYHILRRGLWRGDVIFMSNDPNLLLIFTFWKKILRLNYKVCSDWHQLFEDWRDDFIAQNSTFLISTSKRLQSMIVKECSVPKERVLVAYGGIDPAPFDKKRSLSNSCLRTTLGLPLDKFLVGYVGGFRSVGLEKGLRTMIYALEHLENSIVMVFVGGTQEDIDEYSFLAESIGVYNRCIFVPKQHFERVVEYELALNVLVIPYPDQHHFRDYGFPMKVWEYMASGKPIIYSNLEIISEILEGRATPFIPDDAESLASVISSIYNDRAPAEMRAEQNIENVLAYTWDVRVDTILNFMSKE